MSSCFFFQIAPLFNHPDVERVIPEFGQTFLREIIHSPFRIVYRPTQTPCGLCGYGAVNVSFGCRNTKTSRRNHLKRHACNEVPFRAKPVYDLWHVKRPFSTESSVW